MTFNISKIITAAALTGLSLASFNASAQADTGSNPSANEAAAMQLSISQLQANRQLVVAENLPLSDDKAGPFWDLYREYANERAKLVEKEVKIILEFRDNFETLTDDQAKRIINEYIKSEDQYNKLRKKYLSKFRRVLSEVETLRYFQIENKLDDIISFEVSQVIPLAYQDGAPEQVEAETITQ